MDINMQLTRYTDYGIRTLMYLAVQPKREKLFRIAEITEVFDFSANHVSKIVHHMGKLGYLDTMRGKSGGFRLGKDASDINIGKLVRELENSLNPIDCERPHCRFAPVCKLKIILNEAIDAYLATLDKFTLSDIVSNQSQLVELLPQDFINLVDEK